MAYYFAVEARHKMIGIGAPNLAGVRVFLAVSGCHTLEKQTCLTARALAGAISRPEGLS